MRSEFGIPVMFARKHRPEKEATMEPTTRQSCFARMLDVRSYVLAARRSMAHAEPATALYMIVVFGIIALVLTPVYLTFDLGSTWDFTTGLRDAAEPAVGDVTGQIDGWLGLSVGAALAGAMLTAFTLLPSLFEVAFPSVAHPLLTLVLTLSIVFDYVTDWGKTWDLVGTWTDNAALQFLFTMPLCAFFSVGVQAVLVCCLTVIIFGVITVVRGSARQAQAVLIQP
jgi:hypothetical protein